MNPSLVTSSLINTTAEDLIYIYLSKKYISNPAIFKLPDFSIEQLLKNSFERTGDDFYCMYEKSYRIANSNVYTNIKNYFQNNQFISNGLDLSNGRLCTILSNLQKKYNQTTKIDSIEFLLDDSLEYGSLIVNKFLDIRFGKLRDCKYKSKFHFTGISTDYEIPSDSTEKKVSTNGARIMKNKFSFSHLTKLSKDNPAIKELVICVLKNFPRAI